MKVARLSVMHTSQLIPPPPGDISGNYSCCRQNTKYISLNNLLKQNKQSVGRVAVLPVTRQKFPLYFIGYLEFFTVFQNCCLFFTISCEILKIVLQNPGEETLVPILSIRSGIDLSIKICSLWSYFFFHLTNL